MPHTPPHLQPGHVPAAHADHDHLHGEDYDLPYATESIYSGVSWGAIIAGAVAATSLVLILLSIGSGLGLAAVSPWKHEGASAGALGVSMVIGLIVVQWLSAAFGGYITGRLRTRWSDKHADEVYFRDTAHGFLTWALGAVFGAILLTSAATSAISGVGSAISAVGTGAALGASQGATQSDHSTSGWMDTNGYYLDGLFRTDRPNAQATDAEVRAETTRILVRSMQNETIAPEDRTYLAQVIANRTGITQEEAQARIDNTVAKLKEAEVKARAAADVARKQAAKLAMYTALSMLIGAFVACAAAALGGRHRDEL